MKESFWRLPSRAGLRKRGKRLLVGGALAIALVAGARALWNPGLTVTDGRDDRGRNAMWLQHGWIGADSWFVENEREWKKPLFRSDEKVRELAAQCAQNGITDIYPHLAPTQPDGSIMPVDDAQLKRFLNGAPDLRVMPWIGGVKDADITLDLPARRQHFLDSVAALLRKYPRLAGVHLNVEPWPSGDAPMLVFLDDLRAVLPPGKILSVAAYPPPSRLHPFPEVHWDEAYFRQVAARCDQMAVMVYDTSLRDPKMFEWLAANWNAQIFEWTEPNGSRPNGPQILIGVPTYADEGVGYHHPGAENLTTGLRALHRALSRFDKTPANYQGAAIYSEWETDASEWKSWQKEFH